MFIYVYAVNGFPNNPAGLSCKGNSLSHQNSYTKYSTQLFSFTSDEVCPLVLEMLGINIRALDCTSVTYRVPTSFVLVYRCRLMCRSIQASYLVSLIIIAPPFGISAFIFTFGDITAPEIWTPYTAFELYVQKIFLVHIFDCIWGVFRYLKWIEIKNTNQIR